MFSHTLLEVNFHACLLLSGVPLSSHLWCWLLQMYLKWNQTKTKQWGSLDRVEVLRRQLFKPCDSLSKRRSFTRTRWKMTPTLLLNQPFWKWFQLKKERTNSIPKETMENRLSLTSFKDTLKKENCWTAINPTVCFCNLSKRSKLTTTKH